jgi:hypothetical protein
VILIVDIDGTVADPTHRLHFIQRDAADWRAFYAAAVDDTPILEMVALVDILARHFTVVFVTGRSSEIDWETINWLAKHGLPTDYLYMRKEGDYRQDSVVKSEILDQIILQFQVQPSEMMVFEDRKQVVDMYRARGIRTLQVAPGEF